ncbi:MAG: hypothetical protein OXH16_01325 [Gemmatimonadetes bacterium]|nr:hypothetical protein [Gemmatimonadota bacterium]
MNEQKLQIAFNYFTRELQLDFVYPPDMSVRSIHTQVDGGRHSFSHVLSEDEAARLREWIEVSLRQE